MGAVTCPKIQWVAKHLTFRKGVTEHDAPRTSHQRYITSAGGL